MQGSQPAIIAAWQRGDEQAVHLVFTMYYPRAVRLAVLGGLSLEAAEDCAQEAFVHAFQRRRQLRDPVAFPLWFHRIVTRHLLDTLRNQQHHREQPLELADELSEDWGRHQLPQPDEQVISSEEREHLWHAVQLLSSQHRVPLVLHYYGDFSFREVATIMGKREGTVRVIIHRALQQLRTLAQKEIHTSQEQTVYQARVSQSQGEL